MFGLGGNRRSNSNPKIGKNPWTNSMGVPRVGGSTDRRYANGSSRHLTKRLLINEKERITNGSNESLR